MARSRVSFHVPFVDFAFAHSLRSGAGGVAETASALRLGVKRRRWIKSGRKGWIQAEKRVENELTEEPLCHGSVRILLLLIHPRFLENTLSRPRYGQSLPVVRIWCGKRCVSKG